jgi:hypothetical protein
MVSTLGESITASALVSGVVVSLVWPNPSDVRLGVQYGPTGTEYTGELTGGGGVFLRRR